MNRICVLENTVQDYAWGSHSVIQDLLGLSAEARGRPMAELWMGAHPAAPSRVKTGGRRVPLDRVIRENPESVLGPAAAKAFGARLPFLFKVLAARRPLSIQVHPDAEQAAAGYRRETESGLAPDDPGRSYRDDSHKPELLCALTPFSALKGFRPISEILEGLDRLAPGTLSREAGALRERPDHEGLRGFLRTVLGLDRAQRDRVTREVLERTEGRTGLEDASLGWTRRLAQAFPGDAGILAPALMNLTVLQPGEAMCVEPGEIHAYLEGAGLELMANSDNVIRGGLTPKTVDVDEFLRVVLFRSGGVRSVRPQTHASGMRVYASGTSEFVLTRIDVSPDHAFAGEERRSVEIHLCLQGEGAFLSREDKEPLRFSQGDSLLVPASVRGYRIRGEAVLYRASVPIHP